MKNDKASLVEATILALQGKLNLNETKSKSKRTKKLDMKNESLNVSLQDDGSTVVDTDEATVIVQERETVPEVVPSETVPVVTEVPVEEPTETEEVPTIDEIVDEDPEIIEEPTETEEDTLDESKKITESIPTVEGASALIDFIFQNYPNTAKSVIDVIAELKSDIAQFEQNDWEDITVEQYNKEHSAKALGDLDESKKIVNESLKSDLEGLTSGLYDYVANNYTSMDKDDLKEIALNAIYVANNDEEIIKETLDRITESKTDCTEEECPECKKEEAKIKYNAKSFKRVIENYYKEHYKAIKEFKINKFMKNSNSIKIEGQLINKHGKTKEICLEAKEIQKGRSFTKYSITGVNPLKLESNDNKCITMMTLQNKNILECKYMKTKEIITK